MSGNVWYQLNIYPNARNGHFTTVFVENKGFHIPCERCKRRKCPKCADYKKSYWVNSWYDQALGEGLSPHEILLAALNAVVSGYDRRVEGAPPPDLST